MTISFGQLTFKPLFSKVSQIIKDSSNDESIVVKTEKSIDKYLKYIDNCDESEFSRINTSKSETLQVLTIISSTIIDSINYFLEGDILGGVDCADTLFEYLRRSTINKTKVLYRGRTSMSNYLFNRKEMFHIPFDKRNLVNNQRFSLSGFPCLYLGEKTFTCWEELERPDFGMCNFTALKSLENITLYDLSLPYIISTSEDIYAIAIIIACSIKANKTDPFKPAYIFPQLILHNLIRNRKKGPDTIYGLKYHSTSIYNNNEHLFPFSEIISLDDINRYLSYVIPVIKIKPNGYCDKLAKLFEVSESISNNFRTYQKSIFQSYIASSQEDYDPLYQNSCFNDLDSFLEKAEMKNLNDTCKRTSSYKIDKFRQTIE